MKIKIKMSKIECIFIKIIKNQNKNHGVRYRDTLRTL